MKLILNDYDSLVAGSMAVILSHPREDDGKDYLYWDKWELQELKLIKEDDFDLPKIREYLYNCISEEEIELHYFCDG